MSEGYSDDETGGFLIVNLPNSITVFRIVLIPVFTWQFLLGNWKIAALIFFIAWVSDVLDGYIARKYDLVTNFGKIFDPLADKLITLTALFLMSYREIIPPILPIIVLTKEVTLGVGGILMYKKLNKVVGAKWVGKIATFLFSLSIILMLFEPAEEIALTLIWAALAVAFVALITYVVNFFRVVTVNKYDKKVKQSE